MTSLLRGLALAVALVVAAALAWGTIANAAAQDATPPADAEDDTVGYVDEDGAELARLVVGELTDPVDNPPAGVAPEDDERFVLVPIGLANTGDDPFPFDPQTILLRDEDGFLYGADDDFQAGLEAAAATPTADDEAGRVPLAGGDLAPGEDRSGFLGYAVRAEAELAEVIFVPETGRLLVLAELGDDDQPGLARRTGAAQDADRTPTPRSIDDDATETPEPTETPDATETPEADDEPTPTPEPEPTVAPEVDGDQDGLSDDEEAALGTDPAAGDTDGDGLVDIDELNIYATDPLDPDSDDDGALDGDEAGVGTDPVAGDTDGDGLGDADETATGTDPLVPDSDGDGVLDGDEVAQGTDPLVAPEAPTATAEPAVEATVAPTAAPATTAGAADSDGDTLSDADETALGSDPFAADTDGDGLPDGDEVSIHGTSPLTGDTDGDGVSDLTEVAAGPTPTP